jgi:spermidine dehydrogenase
MTDGKDHKSEFSDHSLGMDRKIDRRDFLYTVGAGLAGSLLAPAASGLGHPQASNTTQPAEATEAQNPYPPLRTGMRGDHPGSFEAAHEMRDRREWDLSGAIRTDDAYDLIIVGGGISGLSAAHFFLKNVGPKARVLILDNHDDFGGHAKRNEFVYKGRTMAINGGTLNIESPQRYNAPSLQILEDIGIDLDRYKTENTKNRSLYQSFGLKPSYFFDKETWDKDRLVVGGLDYEVGVGRTFSPHFLAQTPLSATAQKDMLRLFDLAQPDYLPGLTSAEKKLRLAKISYNDYLLNVAKVDKQVIWFFQNVPAGVFAVGTDATPALFCWEMGLPGFHGLKLDPTPDGVLADLPGGQHGRQKESGTAVHFPDGNATVARLLVRSLIPDAVPGKTMDDVGMARVNYAYLDRAGQKARIRLSSTVVNVSQEGDPAKAVVVSYVSGGKTYQVRGAAAVMACWNMFIPYLVPTLPDAQKKALAYNVKAPLVYTSVALRNWKSFQKLGIRSITTPTMYHTSVALTEAATLGELRHPQTPEEPIVLHLVRTPCSPGLSRKDQYRAGRYDLLSTNLETFERKIRDQLARTLGAGGFDPAEDIVGITVNRWPHGYSYTYSSLYDPLEWVYSASPERPCVIARQPFGLISIANADAAASPHTDAAILEAYRAVTEVIDRRSMPLLA